MSGIPFTTIDWSNIPIFKHSGETGIVSAQTIQYPGLEYA